MADQLMFQSCCDHEPLSIKRVQQFVLSSALVGSDRFYGEHCMQIVYIESPEGDRRQCRFHQQCIDQRRCLDG